MKYIKYCMLLLVSCVFFTGCNQAKAEENKEVNAEVSEVGAIDKNVNLSLNDDRGDDIYEKIADNPYLTDEMRQEIIDNYEKTGINSENFDQRNAYDNDFSEEEECTEEMDEPEDPIEAGLWGTGMGIKEISAYKTEIEAFAQKKGYEIVAPVYGTSKCVNGICSVSYQTNDEEKNIYVEIENNKLSMLVVSSQGF